MNPSETVKSTNENWFIIKGNLIYFAVMLPFILLLSLIPSIYLGETLGKIFMFIYWRPGFSTFYFPLSKLFLFYIFIGTGFAVVNLINLGKN